MPVYVPIVPHDQSLLPTLKLSNNGQKWRLGKTLPDIQLSKIQVSETTSFLFGVVNTIYTLKENSETG